MDDLAWLNLMHGYLVAAGQQAAQEPERAITALIPNIDGRPPIMSPLDWLALQAMLARHGFTMSPTIFIDASGQRVRVHAPQEA